MKLFQTIRDEFRFNYGKKKQLISILGIFFIPIIYAGVYLWAFWDPYGHLNRLPVAVVNNDKGAIYDGEKIDAGQKLVNQLRSNHDFDWNFVSADKANRGLEDNQYYMVITIPKNFSSEVANAATTVGAPQPKLKSVTNDRENYISGIIGRNAMVKLQSQTAQQIAKTYTANLVTGVEQLETGFHKASNGAEKLANGAVTLKQSGPQLVSGAARLASSQGTLVNGIAKASTGAQEVASGTKSVYQGNQQLSQGLGQLASAAGQLNGAATKVSQGAQQLKSGLATEVSGAKQTATGASQLAQGLSQYASAHPDVASDPSFQALLQASQQVATGSSQVSSASASLAQGANQLATGTTALQQGLNRVTPKLQQASQGAKQLVKQEPALVDGSQTVASGLAQLQAGANQLQSGTGILERALRNYTNGTTEVAGGATQLASQLNRAVDKMPVLHAQQVISATSNPVGVSQLQAGDVDNYGTGFAPYFLSLGLFVGPLLMSVIVAFRNPAKKPSSGFAWFLSKTLLVGSIAVVQALIADAILLFGLGLHVHNVTDFVLFSLLTSMTFVSLIQFFVTVMDNPGRFIAIILLVLQLTSSSGTYPVILSPTFFRDIHPYLPMTYTVDGFRYIVGGGKVSFMHNDLWHLFLYWGIFLGLTLVYYLVRGRRLTKEDAQHPTSHEGAMVQA
ncbi:phage infection protein [Alicyclobacillus acidoterrestris]|uniref:YhgE/Pip family protein n=1 Tax=Alicyclobacillus suci TaxID=2816080 RepID=UPI00118F709B|nr:YhgE/Pip domain-containing protein [Alicyclobacillus suci]GEO26397.1 phage infection protein [Alicyclobacillus acidoterrestris]